MPETNEIAYCIAPDIAAVWVFVEKSADLFKESNIPGRYFDKHGRRIQGATKANEIKDIPDGAVIYLAPGYYGVPGASVEVHNRVYSERNVVPNHIANEMGYVGRSSYGRRNH